MRKITDTLLSWASILEPATEAQARLTVSMPFKPIDQVMADAADLVRVRHTLRQIVNVKGD